MLISGNFGFSKTFSTILYKLLTDYIVKYRIKYKKSQRVLPKSIFNRPKVIYWPLQLT